MTPMTIVATAGQSCDQLFQRFDDFFFPKMQRACTPTTLAFEGFYGMRLSLESQCLTLESAMWNAGCSATGFSLSRFWPTTGSEKIERI